MALTMPPNGSQMAQQDQGEELDRQTTYSSFSIHSSNAHLGNSYHTEHHHYYYPPAPADTVLRRRSRQSQARNPEAVDDEPIERLLVPVEEEEGWISTLADLSCEAYVHLPDQKRDDKKSDQTDAACDVKVEVKGDDLITNSRRNLAIDWKDPDRKTEHFWVPGTYMKVAQTDNTLEVEFSDCKQKANATKDYVNNYTAVYRPAKPNVSITFEFPDNTQAAELQARLLHYQGPSAPVDQNEILFPQHCTVRHDSIKCIDGKTLGRGLFVWSHITDSETGQKCKVLDFGCFTSQLDFEIEVLDNTFVLYVRSFMKVRYEPIDVGKNAYWPPRKVEDNKSGAPAYMEVALDPKDDALVMKSPLDKGVTLLTSTIGHESGTSAKAWFNLEYVENFRKLSRNRHEQGQLTLWNKEGYLYGLLRRPTKTDTKRRSSSLDEGEDQPSERLWRALRWKKDKSRPKAEFDDTKVAMDGIESMTGDYLSREDNTALEPRTRDASSSTTWEKTKIEFRFKSREEIDRFAAIIRKFDVK